MHSAKWDTLPKLLPLSINQHQWSSLKDSFSRGQQPVHHNHHYCFLKIENSIAKVYLIWQIGYMSSKSHSMSAVIKSLNFSRRAQFWLGPPLGWGFGLEAQTKSGTGDRLEAQYQCPSLPRSVADVHQYAEMPLLARKLSSLRRKSNCNSVQISTRDEFEW